MWEMINGEMPQRHSLEVAPMHQDVEEVEVPHLYWLEPPVSRPVFLNLFCLAAPLVNNITIWRHP